MIIVIFCGFAEWVIIVVLWQPMIDCISNADISIS